MNSLVQSFRCAVAQIELPPVPPQARKFVVAARRAAFGHRRSMAVALSLLLHILFLWLLLPHARQALSGGGSHGVGVGGGTGETWYAVDLRTLPSPALATKVKAPEGTAAEALDPPDPAVKPSVEPIQSVIAEKQSPAKLDTPPPAEAVSAAHPAAMAGAGQDGTTMGAGDLWGAIAPCWKRVAGSDTLPVTLEITFTADGALAKPPVIDRASGSPITPQSLRSEAQALSALAQCGAYPMAAGRSDVKVDFPKPE
jgi:hypothetical protein